MKKTSIALLLGLFALGCGANPPPKSVTAPVMSPADMMKMQHASPPAAPAGEEKKEGDAPAAAPAADGDKPAEKPAEEKKEADAPAKPE